MRFSEFAGSNQPAIKPSIVNQQQRIAKVVNGIAASNAKKEPTELDKVLAMRRYAGLQKQTDKEYVRRLKRQLAAAEQVGQ